MTSKQFRWNMHRLSSLSCHLEAELRETLVKCLDVVHELDVIVLGDDDKEVAGQARRLMDKLGLTNDPA